MSSAHMAVRDAVVALCAAASTLSGALIAGNRGRAMPANADRMVNACLDESMPAEVVLNALDWATRIRLECAARTTLEGAAEARADQLVAGVCNIVLAPGALASLGVSHIRLRGLRWAEDELDTSVAVAIAVIDVHHRTSATSITA